MAATYTPIATTTLGSAAASYTFSSIPSTYTDLVLIVQGTSTASGVAVNVQYNSDTGSNYSKTMMYGNGSAAGSQRNSNATSAGIGSMYSTMGQIIANIQNYANSTTYKTSISRFGSTGDNTAAFVGLWRNTAAITSVTVTTDSSTFTANSTFTLYGIKAA